MFLTLLLVSMLAAAQSTLLKPTYIKNPLGVLHHPKGNLRYSDSNFKTVYTVNLTTQKDELEFVRKHLNTSKELCQKLNNKTSQSHYNINNITFTCSQFHYDASLRIENLQEMFDDLFHLSPRQRKQKRSLSAAFEGGGNWLNWAIGSATKKDFDDLKDALNNLEKKEKEQSGLEAKNLHIMKSLIDLRVNQSARFKRAMKVTNENFAKIQEFTKQRAERVYTLEDAFELNAFDLTLNYMINKIEADYESMITALEFAKLNILSPSIGESSKLVESFRNEKLYSGYEFPVEMEYDKLLKISDISVCNLNKTLLIFMIKTPIVNSHNYELFEIFPYPIVNSSGNTMLLIKPNHTFLYARNSSDKHFGFLDNLDKCKDIDAKNRVCSINEITNYTEETCERSLWLMSNPNPTSKLNLKACQAMVLNGDVTLIENLGDGEWLIVTNIPKKYTYECHGNVTESGELKNTVQVKLDGDCVMKIDGKSLHGSKTINIASTVEIPVATVLDQSQYSLEFTYRNYTFVKVHLSDLDVAELKELMTDLETAQKRLENMPAVPEDENLWDHSMQMIAILLGIVVVSYFILKCCGCCAIFDGFCCCCKQILK